MLQVKSTLAFNASLGTKWMPWVPLFLHLQHLPHQLLHLLQRWVHLSHQLLHITARAAVSLDTVAAAKTNTADWLETKMGVTDQDIDMSSWQHSSNFS